MEKPHSTTDNFKIIVIASLVLLASAVVWLAYRVENLPETSSRAAKSADTTNQDSTGYGYTTVTSGGGLFQANIPAGWGPVLNVTNSDMLVIPGTKQPITELGKKAEIKNVEGYGADSASVFSIVLLDKNSTTPPKGEVSELESKEIANIRKYTYIYAADEVIGIGHQRFQGDRDYEYIIPAGDKEMHVYYQVYGSDPANQSVTVDEIVRTIQIKTR